MSFPLKNTFESQVDFESQWADTLAYFKQRGHVIFVSDCRFWEPHGFVQQSLAKTLCKAGVEVTWIDGFGWRSYKPTVNFKQTNLHVMQGWSLPGRRLDIVDRLNSKMIANQINHFTKRNNPVIWIQSGISESIAEQIKYIDIYSIFDDPYRQSPSGALCTKASAIICQNTISFDRFRQAHPRKTQMLLPPVDLSPEAFKNPIPLNRPKAFPEKAMGYIGSFFHNGFDFELFESLLTQNPQWGFFLMGRTDRIGMAHVSRLSNHSNFWYQPWLAREQLARAWKSIDVSLMSYLPEPSQDGALAVKALEALHFGVPSIGTIVPKTNDLRAYCQLSNDPTELVQLAEQALSIPTSTISRQYEALAHQMDPKFHLSTVAAALK